MGKGGPNDTVSDFVIRHFSRSPGASPNAFEVKNFPVSE